MINFFCVYFRPFLNAMINVVQETINGKSVEGVHGIQTQDRSKEGEDKSTELWHPTYILFFYSTIHFI